MSMRPLPSLPVPVATAALARAVFPAGRLAMRLRDELGEVFSNADFTETWLTKVPAVALLARVWEQQYVRDRRRTVRQRTGKELPPGAQRIISPYDPDPRVGIKRSTRWDGYKLHLTETCDADGATPHLHTRRHHDRAGR